MAFRQRYTKAFIHKAVKKHGSKLIILVRYKHSPGGHQRERRLIGGLCKYRETKDALGYLRTPLQPFRRSCFMWKVPKPATLANTLIQMHKYDRRRSLYVFLLGVRGPYGNTVIQPSKRRKRKVTK